MRPASLHACFLFLLGLPLAACTDGGRTNLQRSERKAAVDRTALDLGHLEPGVPAEGRVRLTNQGEGLLEGTIQLDPRDGPFVVLFPNVTADLSGTDITVRFVAFEPGSFSAVMHIHTDSDVAPSDFDVTLTATVDPPPQCDDGNPCTLDLRQGAGCEHIPVAGTCDDANTCTVADRCVDGACLGQPITCDDGVDCTVDTCDGTLGCTFMPRNEACEDSNPCTLDVCAPLAGCTNAVAPTGTLCGIPVCDAMPLCIDGTCVTSQAPDGFPCEDGDPCSLGDTCRMGACQRGLGEPFGVGDPVIAAIPEVETGLRDPVNVLGLQPLGNARVRVAVQLAPRCGLGACPPIEDPCVVAADEPAPGHVVALVEVWANGTRTPGAELPLPEGHRLVDARGVLTPAGLVVLQRSVGTVDCSNLESPPDPIATLSLTLVRTDGSMDGPHLVTSAQHDPMGGTVGQAVMALGAQDNALAIMVGRRSGLLCLGDCPEVQALEVLALNASQWPPVLEAQNAVTVILPDSNVNLDAVRDLRVTRFEGEVHATWRAQTSGVAASCGGVAEVLWSAWSWHAPVDQGLVASPERLGDGLRQDVDVTMAVGAVGPAVFLARQEAGVEPPPCDADNCAVPACNFIDTVEVMQGGETTTVWTATATDATGVRAISAGSAFGRAVGLILEQGGALHLRAPAMGPLPEVAASYVPPENAPVRLSAAVDPLLVADGRLGWLGALFDGNVRGASFGAAAVVLAGCGVQSTGTILGLPTEIPDAGPPPDAAVEEPDAGGTVVSSTPEDGGNTADGGVDADAGTAGDDAGASDDAGR